MKNNYRIMVVDDEHIVREAISSSIPWEKYQVEVVYAAANAVDALEYLKDHEVDMMLVDIRMPVMDGLEATRLIRAEERDDAKKIPIIAMSANAFDEDVRLSLDAGMDVHLSKPVEPQLLYETLEKFTKERPS